MLEKKLSSTFKNFKLKFTNPDVLNTFGPSEVFGYSGNLNFKLKVNP